MTRKKNSRHDQQKLSLYYENLLKEIEEEEQQEELKRLEQIKQDKIIQNRKKQYNKEYYIKVRKNKHKIDRCKIYNIEYKDNEEIKIMIEHGHFVIPL